MVVVPTIRRRIAAARRWMLTLVLLAAASSAYAQRDDRRAAAEAYNRGTTEFLEGNYSVAARHYEAAYDFAPTAEALVQAARSHDAAGDSARASTLALVLQRLYPEHPIAPQTAAELLAKHRKELLLVRAECGDCSLQLDGNLQPEREFFVQPGAEHTVVGTFATGQQSRDFSGPAGDEIELTLTAPKPPAVTRAPKRAPPRRPKRATRAESPAAGEQTGARATEEAEAETGAGAGAGARAEATIGEHDRPPFGPLVVYVTAGLTVGMTVVGILSTLDTLGGVDEYENAADAYQTCSTDCQLLEQRARQLLDDGRSKQTLTNLSWIATGVVATGTLLTALLWTDWKGRAPDTDHGVSFGLTPDPRGMEARIGVRAAF